MVKTLDSGSRGYRFSLVPNLGSNLLPPWDHEYSSYLSVSHLASFFMESHLNFQWEIYQAGALKYTDERKVALLLSLFTLRESVCKLPYAFGTVVIVNGCDDVGNCRYLGFVACVSTPDPLSVAKFCLTQYSNV